MLKLKFHICKLIFIFLFFCFLNPSLSAQEDYIILDKITLSGNEKTKDAVIFRELPFGIGDTILLNVLAQKLEEGESQLMNTGLFTNSKITYEQWEGATKKVQLLVSVKETWYIYPFPIFDIADRNFNVWWKEHNRTLERVNIGLEFKHTNFSGWGDKLEVEFRYGYTRSYQIKYKRPYINKKRTIGVSTLIDFARNRELAYVTEDNKQLFFKNDDEFIRKRWRLENSLTWRPAYYGEHTFGLSYFDNWVDTTVTQLNQAYFSNGTNQQKFVRLSYSFAYDRRDNRAYPWKGYKLGGTLEKDGLGIFDDRNALTLRLFVENYWPIKNRWSFGLGAHTKYSFIRKIPSYNENRAIGYGGNKVSGYELYVVDGLDLALIRSSLRFEIWTGDVTFGKWVLIEAFRYLPFRVNAIFSSDVGYVNSPFVNPNNTLNNQFLLGGGVGLDLVFYYDFVFRIQYSYNKLREGGLFLDFKIGI